MTEKYIKVSECEKYFYEHLDDLHMTDAMNAIDEMLNVDVVEIIHCKNCRYVDDGYIGKLYCRMYSSKPVSANDYCSWGEPKDTPTTNTIPVKHGKWVYDHWCELKCSECGEYSNSKPYKGKEKYCPNCGAKMDGNEVE